MAAKWFADADRVDITLALRGEGGVDGHHENFSDNCGIEGATDDEDIVRRRALRQRNLLATLFLSQGTPMLLAGDEFSNSQQHNRIELAARCLLLRGRLLQ